jgi:hypothetical protein
MMISKVRGDTKVIVRDDSKGNSEVIARQDGKYWWYTVIARVYQ